VKTYLDIVATDFAVEKTVFQDSIHAWSPTHAQFTTVVLSVRDVVIFKVVCRHHGYISTTVTLYSSASDCGEGVCLCMLLKHFQTDGQARCDGRWMVWPDRITCIGAHILVEYLSDRIRYEMCRSSLLVKVLLRVAWWCAAVRLGWCLAVMAF
jgi:hypothetical protein